MSKYLTTISISAQQLFEQKPKPKGLIFIFNCRVTDFISKSGLTVGILMKFHDLKFFNNFIS